MKILFLSNSSPEELSSIWHFLHSEMPDIEIQLFKAINEGNIDANWDVIILDSDSSFNNIETIHTIRSSIDAPLVVISNELDEEDIVGYIKAGADNYFLKTSCQRLLAFLNQIPLQRKESGNSKYILNTLINEVSDVVWVKDLQGRYLMINEAGVKVFKKNISDIIGKNDYELFVHETAEKIRKTDLAVLHNGQTLTIEDRLVTLEGKERTFLAVKAAYRDATGRIQGVLGIIRDISERKQMEEELRQAKMMAEEATNKKSQFLANMSHELRTPLHNIITSSNIVLEGLTGPLDPVIEEYFSYINQSGLHLLQIIDALLDISKIEAGKLTLQKHHLILTEFIQEVIALVHPLIIQKRQSLVLDTHPQVPAVILGDSVQLKQVICNLLSNAHKFSLPESHITLSCYPNELTNSLCFSVKDEGPGISKKDLKRIFEPFEQLEKHSSYIKGTGLGLSLAKKLAELHGGSLKVRSTLGKGSTFVIEIPVTVPAIDVLQKEKKAIIEKRLMLVQ